MNLVLDFMQHEINLNGYTFSIWSMIVFVAVATIAMKFLHELFF